MIFSKLKKPWAAALKPRIIKEGDLLLEFDIDGIKWVTSSRLGVFRLNLLNNIAIAYNCVSGSD